MLILLCDSGHSLAAEGPSASAVQLAHVGEQIAGDLFDTSMLVLPGVDLSRYARARYFAPGTYLVDVLLNDRLVGREEVRFVAPQPSSALQPCLSDEQVRRFGVRPEKVATLQATAMAAMCADVFSAIESSEAYFAYADLALRLTVPQAALSRTVADGGLVAPELLDDGVSALMLGYSANGYWRGESSSQFVMINGRANTGPWRWYWGGSAGLTEGRVTVSSSRLQAQRTINPLRAQLQLGQLESAGQALPAVPLVGARLASEAAMLPSYAGATPKVQGVARTQAHVVLRQRGRIVFETAVTPGPFVLDDFSAPDRADVEVSVEESDGTVSTFVVPYFPAIELLAPGEWRYDLAAGKGDFSASLYSNPWVIQAEARRGLTETSTVFGGVQAAWGDAGAVQYTAVNAGVSLTSRFGAFRADITNATARATLLGGGVRQDNSLRLSYQTTLQATNSEVAVAAYRFSGRDYLTLFQVADSTAQSSAFTDRHRLDLMLVQPIGRGRLSARASLAEGWKQEAQRSTYSLQYSVQLGSVSAGLSLNRSHGAIGVDPTRVGLSLSMPLGPKESAGGPTASFYSSTSRGVTDLTMGLSGSTELANQPVSTSVSLGLNTATFDERLSLSASTSLDKVSVSGGVSQASAGGGSAFASGSGGLIWHDGGVTFAREVSDTAALVHAAGATGASVAGGNRIDDKGYAVAFVSPFRDNEIDIDTAGSARDLELKTTRKHVIPGRGALVKVEFEARKGRMIIIEGTTTAGRPLPFGAMVADEDGNEVGLVGQGGSIFARVEPQTNMLRVSWGRGIDDGCDLPFEAPTEPTGEQRVARTSAVCQVPVTDTRLPPKPADVSSTKPVRSSSAAQLPPHAQRQ